MKRDGLISKKKKANGIYFVGNNASNVTGSQIYVKYGNLNILLECGGVQSNNRAESYALNNKRFPFPVKDLDYVFVNHAHIDHCMLLPKLLRYGFNGKIICTSQTAKVMRFLLQNSAYICQEDAKILTKRKGKYHSPITTLDEADTIMDYVYEYDGFEEYKLNDSISFRWYNNSHCVGSTQLELNLYNERDGKKSILYTSDLGGIPRFNYVENTEIPNKYFDVAIMESTYGERSKEVLSKKKFSSEMEKFKVSILQTLENGGKVLIPSFAFSRTQQIITALFETFGSDNNFLYDVVVDGKMACDISELYSSILNGEHLDKYKQVYSWKNLKFIKDKEDSKYNIACRKPKIVISSSGFCTAGRIINYLSEYLKDDKNLICFCGFIGSDESYLSYRIKNSDKKKTININHIPIKNAANCIAVNFFSSHANYNELINFGKELNCQKIYLVHGSKEAKENIKNSLQSSLLKNNKTTRVICSSKDMFARL